MNLKEFMIPAAEKNLEIATLMSNQIHTRALGRNGRWRGARKYHQETRETYG
jgi:hypothetical protein